MSIKRIAATSIAALSIAFTGACSTSEGGPAAITEVRPAGVAPGPALWSVSDEDTTIYLFGTVHALPKDVDWFDGKVERAFNASDELVTEIDLGDAAASSQALAAAGMLPPGQKLRELMTEENRRQYEEALVALGLPVEALDRLEPWFAAMTLTLLPLMKDGFQTETGVEFSLGNKAGEKKKRGALETIDDQIQLFDSMPMEDQLTFLDETVETVPKAGSTLNAMIAEWLEGDADDLADLLNAEMTDPALYARLLTNRNAHWADWIKKRLDQPGTIFIAVGAGHLAGKGSVQDQLRQRGLEVDRIWE
ncbi:hypothetical protein FHS61_002034 [Altererythrobacter atlanticus]|uniref:TraB family protein n=1 Tax=Croceibacterium atlanticum TaxID=1267766 RepID=A0A0F7KR22_9SPHN|nr:TraB/GumN family protein [Croceibacterium atlanticum]AKH41546.1 TraB family protein [Croceibacterium atlanticum]MBB5733008.1 hypothetical protein [Croceibacterium atlanticum]